MILSVQTKQKCADWGGKSKICIILGYRITDIERHRAKINGICRRIEMIDRVTIFECWESLWWRRRKGEEEKEEMRKGHRVKALPSPFLFIALSNRPTVWLSRSVSLSSTLHNSSHFSVQSRFFDILFHHLCRKRWYSSKIVFEQNSQARATSYSTLLFRFENKISRKKPCCL